MNCTAEVHKNNTNNNNDIKKKVIKMTTTTPTTQILNDNYFFDKHHKRRFHRRRRHRRHPFINNFFLNLFNNILIGNSYNNNNNNQNNSNNGRFKIVKNVYVILIVLISSHFILPINCGCRIQSRNDCERVCFTNSTTGQMECKLRAVVIMPNSTDIEASLPRVLPVMTLAENKVRELQIIPDNLIIEWKAYDDHCDPSYASISAMDGYGLDCAHVLFGPTCEYALAPVSRVVKYFRMDGTPLITAGGFSSDYSSNKTTCDKEYHMLIRTGLLSFQAICDFFHAIMNEYNWSQTILFFDRYAQHRVGGKMTCHLFMQSLAGMFRQNNFTFTSFNTDTAINNMTENLKKEVGLDKSIVVMCANPSTVREIMLAAEELNMVDSGEYVFFNIELFDSLSATTTQPWYNETDTVENNERAKKAYTALLTVIAKQPEASYEYMKFSEEVKELAAAKYNYNFSENEPVSPFVTAFYDAVLLYAYALNKSITEDPMVLQQPMNGTKMIELMWNTNFRGITGNVTIDSNGDRISDYSLLDMNPITGYFEVVANYFNKTGLQYVSGKSIHWAGGKLEPPLDKPVCGFDNSLCPDKSLPGYAILSFVLSGAVIIMGIVSLVGYKHYRLEAEINSMTWKINYNDLLLCNPANKHRGSLYSVTAANRRGSHLSVASDESGSIANDKQVYIPIGFYKGCKVAIKKIEESNINLNRAQMLELKRMKDIQHEHLVRFYGACVDTPNCCILTEYCPKGSLQDILENDQIKLDWMFKLSLMHDIVRGMHFLHTTDIRSHGNLKSSNCVVDSRFVLKITDFGLHQMRKALPDDEIENKDSFAYWKKYLWTAPELLRTVNPSPYGSQKGDVYSFAIIVHEITTRQGPFHLGHVIKSPNEIVQYVIDGPINNVPFRPKVDETAMDDVNNFMIKCWAESEYDRPDFSMLKSTIRKINKDNETGNIVDNLLQRMEQYANNLEGLVEERTRAYLDEKKKCEELLYQLLPKTVAAQLIFGRPVIAEVFEEVTIYFSDIVGFTAISAASTPMQVVDLLNDLYTTFDSIVEHFDVYKVETIGDAYMVVSGLPVRNGNVHAREIARMALRLLNNVYKFKIRHRPFEQLKLRIGLHSGSCVAGVVGLKMPRYCLFGDTVNTASRMESNGAALKIHVSQTTKLILDHFETFELEERGLVEMKGKGKMLTYWLLGENCDAINNETLAITAYSSENDPNNHDQGPEPEPAIGLPNNDYHSSYADQLGNQCSESYPLENDHQQNYNNNNNNNHNNNNHYPVQNQNIQMVLLPNGFGTHRDGNNVVDGDPLAMSSTSINGILINTGIKVNGQTTTTPPPPPPTPAQTTPPPINKPALTFNNFVKTNNIKNQQYKKKFSVGEDNIINVTQPLLSRINS